MSRSHLDIALSYLDHFCRAEIEELSELIHDDFHFSGPFIEVDSKESYLLSLKDDPPKNFSVEILKSFEDADGVCLIYDFAKPGVLTPMAQYFKFKEDKVTESLLIFDSRVFKRAVA